MPLSMKWHKVTSMISILIYFDLLTCLFWRCFWVGLRLRWKVSPPHNSNVLFRWHHAEDLMLMKRYVVDVQVQTFCWRTVEMSLSPVDNTGDSGTKDVWKVIRKVFCALDVIGCHRHQEQRPKRKLILGDIDFKTDWLCRASVTK